MQPLSAGIAYSNTSFKASFTNALEVPVKITKVTLNETIFGSPCGNSSVTVSRYDTDKYNSTASVHPTVKAKGYFTVTAVYPLKNDGKAYDMIVAIHYNVTMGGITSQHVEAGHIKGQGEAF